MTTETPTVIDSPSKEDEAVTAATSVPAILGDRLALSPAAMREELTTQVRRYVTEQRTARGTVQVPADAYPLTRTLAAGADALKHYGRVIRALEVEVRSHVEDEAAEIAGDATDGTPTTSSWKGDVVPATNVVVPTEDGDWHITRDWATEVEADWHSLISVQARLTAAAAAAGLLPVWAPSIVEGGDDSLVEREALDFQDADPAQPADLLNGEVEALIYAVAQQSAEDTLERLLFLVSEPKPKTTALTAWAKELSRKGLDDLGSIVASAWSKRRAYRGVSVERA